MKRLLFWSAFAFILILFFVLFYLTSIVPHSLWKTHALDLGMFNHALFSYAHLRPNLFTLGFSGTSIPYLGDHFSPITMLYGPFYYLFGSETLLLIQIIAILFGGIGVFTYARYVGINKWLSLMLMFHFFIIWSIYSALSFDFHNNVIAAMLIPWFILAYSKGKTKMALLLFVLVLISKENMALWMIFILIALIIRKDNTQTSLSKKISLAMLGFSILYFIIVIQFIMPAYSHGLGTNQLGRYGHLGGSLLEIVTNSIKHPYANFSMLFKNTLDLPKGNGVKSTLWFMFIISGGFALVYKPHYLIMIIPIVAQKMLSNNVSLWGIDRQYSIEFAPIISLALVSLIVSMKSNKLQWILLVLLIFTTFYFNKDNIKIFEKKHYQSFIDVKEVNEVLLNIPDDAAISVSSQLAPHLAFRNTIYLFPIIRESKYLALLKHGSTYPITFKEFEGRICELRKDRFFTKIAETKDIIIFRVFEDSLMKTKVKEIENSIRNSKEWYEKIKNQALENNVSIDSMVHGNAIYVYKQEVRRIK